MSRHPLKGLRVHVEGMGVVGSLLAYHLERWGCDWHWHDNDAPVTAWKASTGAIFPAGKPGSLDDQCYRVWDRWVGPAPFMIDGERTEQWRAEEHAHTRPYPLKHFETAAYWFSTKSAPHDGHYQHDGPSKHGLRHARPFSYHLNAQSFVPATRKKFAGRKDVGTRKAEVYIVAHGFSRRMTRAIWGWTVPVKLRYPDVYAQAGYRPCFYFREGRFVMAYAYPIPGTELWYSGSSLIPQTKPAHLDILPKFERWVKTFERLGRGAVRVVGQQAPLEGWRPSEGDAHVDPKVKRSTGRAVGGGASFNVLSVPPMWHNGIRCFPRVLQQVQQHLVVISRSDP